MASLGTAYYTLVPTLKGTSRSLQKQLSGMVDGDSAGKQVGKDLAGGIEAGMAPLKGSFAKIAGFAASAFAAVGFGSLIAEAGRASDAMKKFEATLEFAGLDTSTIDALKKSTREYADETVYELSDIQNITAQLAANGVKDYDRLAEAAGNLNAAAGGSAETYKSVGLVLTQVNGLGKLTTENWNQMAEAIPGVSGRLKEALLANGAFTGSLSDFNKAMENGEISAEEFNEALMDLGFEDAAVEAATSTDTFEGAFGQLKATVTGGLSDMLNTLSPAITGMMNALSDALGPAFEAANKALEEFVGALEEGKSPIDALKAAFDALPESAQQVITGLGIAAGAFVTFKAVSASRA